MVKTGLFARLEAKPGKEKEVAEFLTSALPLAEKEPATTAWFAVQLGPSTFGIFDVFQMRQVGKLTYRAQSLPL